MQQLDPRDDGALSLWVYRHEVLAVEGLEQFLRRPPPQRARAEANAFS